MTVLERKSIALIEVKADAAGDMTFSGYGAVFGNVDDWGDVIVKGAFKASIAEAKATGKWPAMLTQHNGMAMPVGVWTEMKEDDHGLYVEGKIAPTERGKEIYDLLKMEPRPAISGLSIGYVAKDYELHQAKTSGDPRRTLKAVDLFEVSFVTWPANDKARVVNVKSSFNPRELEDGLREAGISRADSVKAVAVFKSMLQRDAEEPISDPRDEEAAAEQRSSEVKLAERIRELAGK